MSELKRYEVGIKYTGLASYLVDAEDQSAAEVKARAIWETSGSECSCHLPMSSWEHYEGAYTEEVNDED